MLGGTIKDAALISGLHEPTGKGTLTFHLYSDEGCMVPVPGFGPDEIHEITEDKEYQSAAFTPDQLGKYYWRVVFSGDANNAEAASACNAPGEISEVTQAQPAITTSASESVRIGEPIKDTAEISGLVKPTGKGTITFHLYSDEACTVPVPGFSSLSEPVTENRSFTSADFPTVTAGLHYWIAEVSGDENNKSVKTECKDGGEVSVVGRAVPTIKTSATNPVIVGQTIEDTATLEGLVNAEGTGKVTFELFDNPECDGTPVHIFTTATGTSGSGNQPVPSDNFTTAKTGTYFWIASFAGDKNNDPIASKCLDANESSVVAKAVPNITTAATVDVAAVGDKIKDTATLSSLVKPDGTGKVTFRLYSNHNCEGPPLFQSTNPEPGGISADGPVSSGEYTTKAPGTVFWVARYSGDANNMAVETACHVPGESTVVETASPSISTSATPSVIVGGKIKDTATLEDLFDPDGTGKVTFRLYSNRNCEGAPLFESRNPSPGGISANGPVSSDEYATEAPGTYFWIAGYSGDAHKQTGIDRLRRGR
jgi:uncharacterized protein YbcV (DUF1398 family)